MELVQTATYSPQQHAFFPHTTHPLLTLHQSARYFSFQTRANELVLADVSTGRMSVLYKAEHPFKCSIFTSDYLLATHATSHEVLVFSLRAAKLKSRLTGHLADVRQLAYCRQNDLIASISNDYCLIHTQKSLTHLKTIKCSTSAFMDCQFALTGSQLFTSFKDGSILLWNPSDWTHRSSAVIAKSPRIASSDGTVLSAYTAHKLWLCDTTQQVVNHQEMVSFWEGEIKQLVFIDNSIVLSTTQGTFVAEFQQKNSFKIVKVLKLDLVSASISHTHYQSTLASLSLDMRKIKIFSLVSKTGNIIKRTNNPLTNQGLVCAGGYSKEEGCHVVNNINTNNCYSTVEMVVQPLTQACYAQIPNKMNGQQLKQFLLKNHVLPDKYRPVAYRHVLNLPISAQKYKQLQRKGAHPSTQLLSSKYPIPNKQLSQSMRQIMSLLAHWEPVLGQSDLVPPIVFGFVCLFGKDTFFCFQVLVRLFSGPLSFLFVEYPLANSLLLQNLWEILKVQDEQLCQHFEMNKIRFTRLAWGLLGSFFTSVLNRENFLAIADLVLVRIQESEIVLFVCLGYLIFNRKRLLSVTKQNEANFLCEEQQTINLGKFLNTINRLHAKYHKKIRYSLKVWLQRGDYVKLSVPQEAVLLQEQKRNVLVEQLQKQKQNEYQKQKMLQEMQKMIIKARRQAQRQLIETEAYQLHTQNQNNPIHVQPVDRSTRIHKLESLIQELTLALQRQQIGRDQVRQYVPAFQIIKNANDSTLDGLQLKLVELLSEIRPANSLRPFLLQTTNIVKKSQDISSLKGALGARLANKLWQMDELYNEGHGSRWQRGVLSATQK